MKTIVFIDETANIGGAEMNLIRNSPYFISNGWKPLVITPKNGPLIANLKDIGINTLIIPGGPFVSASLYKNSKKIPNPIGWIITCINGICWSFRVFCFLRKKKPELVQTVSMISHFFGGFAAYLNKIPVISHIQDIVDSNNALGLYHRVFNIWARIIPHTLICVSPLVSKQFSSKIATKTKTIYNMIDLEKYNSISDNILKMKENINICSIGRLTPWKGQNVALRSALLLKEKKVKFKWIFAGDASLGDKEYAQSLYHYVQKQNLTDTVNFVGWVQDTSTLLNDSDFFVHLSIEPDPCPLVVIEAMACGLPVIAAKGGGLDNIIVEGGGILVTPNDPKSVTVAIQLLYNNIQEYQKRSEQSRKAAIKYFSPRIITTQWIDLYNSSSL